MVTEAFLGHDVPYPVLNSNDAGYDESVAVAHGCDYYLCYCYYFVMMIDVENSFYSSFDDFGTIFWPKRKSICCWIVVLWNKQKIYGRDNDTMLKKLSNIYAEN